MFGTLRLLLAIMVAIMHTGIYDWGGHVGVVAVVCFYMLSGFVMTGLVRNYYGRLRSVPAFYVDRVMRIYPQYLLFFSLTLLLVLGIDLGSPYVREAPDFRNLFFNLSIIPLDFFMFNNIDRFALIPQAWSLGAELQFYLLIPLILVSRTRAWWVLASLVVFALASMNVIQPIWFGYLLVPGILFMFLMGSLLYDWTNATGHASGRSVLVLYGVVAVVGTFALLANPGFRATLLVDVLAGFLVGAPLLALLARSPRRLLDEWLGNLSYGVFLAHYLVILVIKHYGLFKLEDYFAAYLGLSIALAAAGYYLVERPVVLLRRRLRARSRAPA